MGSSGSDRRPGFRIGVGLRLMAGLLAIIVMAAAIGAVAVGGLRRQEVALRRVVDADVPSLRVAVQLAQRSQGVVANAQRVVSADSHFTRRRFSQWIDDQLKDLSSLIGQLPPEAAAVEEIGRIRELQQSMGERFAALDRAVAGRIDAGAAVRRLVQRLERARVAVGALRADPAMRERLPAGWLAAAEDALGTTATVLLADTPGMLARLERDLGDKRDALMAERPLPDGPATILAKELGALLDPATGAGASAAQRLQTERDVAAQASLAGDVANRFLTAVELLVRGVEEHTAATGAAVQEDARQRLTLFALLLTGAAVLALAVLMFLRLSVLRRLEAVRASMAAHVAGEDSAIPTGGSDEISDIGKALAFFVDTITERETALRTARERAEATAQDLRAAQGRLVQTEKMASLGQLVAGIAHEVNTPIGVALSGVTGIEKGVKALDSRFATGRLSRGDMARALDDLREGAGIVAHAIRRAAELVRSFKLVAPEHAAGPARTFALSDNLQALATLMGPAVERAGCRLRLDCAQAPVIEGQPEVLDRIVEQLVGNALVHAWPEGTQGGEIAIAVAENGEDWLTLTVSDTGVGIPDTVLPRIFDPFFTTRRADGHVGLGLHVVYNLVTVSLGGEIGVSTVPGVGTGFRIRLPRRSSVNATDAAAA